MKRFGHLLHRKKLDYNKFYVFDETMSMIGNPRTSRLVLLEPRKKYSNKEVTKLRLLNRLGWIDRAEDVLATINIYQTKYSR